MNSISKQRTQKSQRYLRAVGSLVLIWATLFIVLGYRRWGCDMPWSAECVATFGRRIESAVLFLWVTDWNALFAAGVALAAAAASVFYLNLQIQQKERFEAVKAERRFAAVRAAMPLTLSAVCDFALNGANAWVNSAIMPHSRHVYGVDTEPPETRTASVTFPLLEPSIREDLMTMIEASDHETAAPYCALLDRLQVIIARSRDHFGNAQGRQAITMVADYCYGQAAEVSEIYARASGLFDSVRDDEMVKETTPPLIKILGALSPMSFHGAVGTEVGQKINRYYG